MRLGHRCQYTKTFILPLFNVIAGQDEFPLPLRYTQLVRGKVMDLVKQLEVAHHHSQRYAAMDSFLLCC